MGCGAGRDHAAEVEPLGPNLHSREGRSAALALAESFVGDREFRRDVLERSLIERDNGYARERLANYAVKAAWDALPEVNFPVTPLTLDASDQLRGGKLEAVLSEQTELSTQSLLELGRSAFELWPSQRSSELELELRRTPQLNRARLQQLGLWLDDRQRIGGLVRTNYDAGVGVAFTCATCHAQVRPSGALQHGPPSAIDLGPLIDRPSWRPGTLDVTADTADDPVAIADLRATRYQTRLHHSGNLENDLAALAVRIETLLITSNGNSNRPPRMVVFALAYYIWWLGEEERARVQGLQFEDSSRGAAERAFEQRCKHCHSGSLGEGDWVPLAELGTDGRVATSPARGTGGYRVPALLGLHERPRGHQARRLALYEWLSPQPSDGLAPHPRAGIVDEDEREALSKLLLRAFAPLD